MRRLTLVVLSTLAVVVPLLGLPPAHAKPARPRAELVAKNVTGTVSAGKVVASAVVKNKGSKKAQATQTTFRLSKDGTASADDPVLGTVATGKIKPKRFKTAAGTFTVPASLPGGSFRVIACADSGLQVKERKDTNNCKASKGVVTIVKNVTVSWAVTGGVPMALEGSVSATAVGGTCTAAGPSGSCAVTSGASTVTLTASGGIPVLLSFTGWGAATPGSCAGVTSGTSSEILTITNPTSNQSCQAGYMIII